MQPNRWTKKKHLFISSFFFAGSMMLNIHTVRYVMKNVSLRSCREEVSSPGDCYIVHAGMHTDRPPAFWGNGEV
jgi:hypothetical protein